MMYYYNDDYLLPLSHDETVHGKATVLQKMYGDYEDKFPQARAFYMYMYAHPGKKLNFMGNEIGQLREWDEKREQDWSILKYPLHDAFHHFMMDLNKIYLNHPSLFEMDYSQNGFKWLDCHQEEPVEHAKSLKLLLASDMNIYRGTTNYKNNVQKIIKSSITLDLAPYSARYYLVQ